MIQINKVLVPVDFSDYSAQAMVYGQELCEKFNAELHLLHVLEVHVTNTPQFTMGLAIPERVEESNAAAMEKLNELPKAANTDTQVVRQTAHGSPFFEIVKYASDNQIDLIAIGTHGRTGYKVVMGSVAEKVVRHAACPVLTVRKEGHQFVAFDVEHPE